MRRPCSLMDADAGQIGALPGKIQFKAVRVSREQAVQRLPLSIIEMLRAAYDLRFQSGVKRVYCCG